MGTDCYSKNKNKKEESYLKKNKNILDKTYIKEYEESIDQRKLIISYNSPNFKKRKGVIGLENLTNTCFMNSSLQCLSHIRPFYEKIMAKKQLGDLGSEFYELLKIMYSDSNDKYFIPTNILYIFPKYYKERRQRGANEFISDFLNILHDEIKSEEYKPKIFEEPAIPILKIKFKKKYNSFYLNNKSFIIDLFYGNNVFLTCCLECHNIINALYSVYNILELSIYQRRKEEEIKLQEIFEDYLAEQKVFDECKKFCENCKSNVKIFNKRIITHTPDILIIYINKVIGHKYYNNYILFPKKLDLMNYVDHQNKIKKPIYNLIGIIEHIGNESFGHYTSKCKNFIDGKWYNFNDLFVDDIPNFEEKIIKNNNAILLFYQIKD